MNNPDVEAVLNYLSIKFNKIFCDREFVSCVIEDFQPILRHKTRPCVLVFPTLGPTYLKALRYQARIFDLAVFSLHSASGKFRSLAVCHKDHLIKRTYQDQQQQPPTTTTATTTTTTTILVQTEMSSSSSRRKRPERQLYVPPAQRRSRLLNGEQSPNTKSEYNNNNNTPSEHSGNDQHQCLNDEFYFEETRMDCVHFYLNDLVNVFYNIDIVTSGNVHRNCEFFKYLCLKQYFCDFFLPQFDNLRLLRDGLKMPTWDSNENLLLNCCMAFPLFSFNSQYPHDHVVNDNNSNPRAGLVIVEQIEEYEDSLMMLDTNENNILNHIICCELIAKNNVVEELQLLDLSMFNLGHYFIISHADSEFLYGCDEIHDVKLCYAGVQHDLKENKCKKNDNVRREKEESKRVEDETVVVEKININDDDNNVIKTNLTNDNRRKSNKSEHEEEKEIMRKAKKNINRRTRPIMKYVDDANDMLKIDKNDSVNNWEDLFDDNGQIQDELLTEIVGKVGDEVTIVAATEDYSAYSTKPATEDLEHVVELYNFPATLETHDLIQAFSDINSDAMYIKWVDDTHALLVLGSLSQAQKAINMQNPLIKVRPMTAASTISMDVASKSDLKPAMKRPETNLQTARRLITSHLGTKSRLSKEQMAKERQDLKNAREKKRLIKQSERDAWEGNIRSTVN